MVRYNNIVDYEVVIELLGNLKSYVREFFDNKELSELAREKYNKLLEIEEKANPNDDKLLNEIINKYSPLLRDVLSGKVKNIIKDI